MKKTHPLATPGQSRIALFTKGRQASVIRDSFLLMQQAAPLLKRGENILYINTLTSAAIVEEVADKISARCDSEVCTYSANSRNMMERLDFLAHTIVARQIKLVVLNAFEFAAVYSRQRVRLATWLREMRDAHGVVIVVYSMYAEQSTGAQGTLSWLADRTQEVGEWQYDVDDSLSTQLSSLAAAQEFSAMLDSDPEGSSEETYYVDRRDSLQVFTMSEIFQKHSLKNNDLAGASTHPDHLDEYEKEIEEEELEMA